LSYAPTADSKVETNDDYIIRLAPLHGSTRWLGSFLHGLGLVLAPPSLPERGNRHGYGIHYADAASWLCSATAEVEAETGSHGLRIGRTSA